MGAKSSTEFGSIALSAEKPSYFQGETLTGTIYLNIVKTYQGTEVIFKMKGKEEAHWTEGSGKNRTHYKTKKIVISHQFPVYKFNQISINQGHYSFPFSIYLPPTLPATFSEDTFSGNAKVEYKIKAELKSSNSNVKSIRNSVPLVIKQTKNDLYAPLQTILPLKVDICCCFKRGTTNFDVRSNKTCFTDGETAYIDCFVDNSQCDLNLTDVSLKFERRMTRISNGGHRNTNTQIIYEAINSVNLPARNSGYVLTKFTIPLKKADNRKLKSSSLGTNVKNLYFLSVDTRYESFCCQCCTKRVDTPILIHEVSDEFQQQLEAPAGWNPQVMPQVEFNWNQGQTYQGRNAGGYDYPVFNPNQFDFPQNNNMNQPNIPPQQNNNFNQPGNNNYYPAPPNDINNNNFGMNYQPGQQQGPNQGPNQFQMSNQGFGGDQGNPNYAPPEFAKN